MRQDPRAPQKPPGAAVRSGLNGARTGPKDKRPPARALPSDYINDPIPPGRAPMPPGRAGDPGFPIPDHPYPGTTPQQFHPHPVPAPVPPGAAAAPGGRAPGGGAMPASYGMPMGYAPPGNQAHVLALLARALAPDMF